MYMGVPMQEFLLEYVPKRIKYVSLATVTIWTTMPNCSPIWFLMCLFTASILFYFILKYGKKFTPVIIAVLVALSYAKSLITGIYFPLKIDVACMAVGFMYVGFLLRKYSVIDKFDSQKLKWLFLVLLTAAGIVSALFNSDIGINRNKFGILPLTYIAGVGLTFVIMFICYKAPFLNNKFLSWLGQNTMIFIGFNYMFRDIATEICEHIPAITGASYRWVIETIITFLGCLLLDYIVFIIKRGFKNRHKEKAVTA